MIVSCGKPDFADALAWEMRVGRKIFSAQYGCYVLYVYYFRSKYIKGIR